MSEKYIFVVIKYPKADTAIEALAALMGLMHDNIVSFKDAVAVTKAETGDLHLQLAQDELADKGFLNGRLIGIIFADLFGVTGWDMNDVYAGTAFAMLGQGIEEKLLDEFGEKMTSAESAVVLLVEHANWRKAADSMRPHNFQGAIVISRNVTGDLADVEKQLEDEKMVVLLPVKDEESTVSAAVKEEESIAPVPEKEAEVPAAMPEKLVIPLPKGLKYIEGIGDAYRQKLRGVGIRNVDELLEKGSTVKGRNEIVNQTGISEKLLLRWVNMADLYRIHGIGQEYARLLEVAGVDTVPELAQRVPAHLHEAMAAANEQKKLVSHLPSASQVESWVSQAKSLPRKINY
ncbi:MAG TPA: DUF4332 domain-containing protein [Anaerolineales bacterium]|nr:DUF4332 domain-containing protein [Anaerolineales bacterium]